MPSETSSQSLTFELPFALNNLERAIAATAVDMAEPLAKPAALRVSVEVGEQPIQMSAREFVCSGVSHLIKNAEQDPRSPTIRQNGALAEVVVGMLWLNRLAETNLRCEAWQYLQDPLFEALARLEFVFIQHGMQRYWEANLRYLMSYWCESMHGRCTQIILGAHATTPMRTVDRVLTQIYRDLEYFLEESSDAPATDYLAKIWTGADPSPLMISWFLVPFLERTTAGRFLLKNLPEETVQTSWHVCERMARRFEARYPDLAETIWRKTRHSLFRSTRQASTEINTRQALYREACEIYKIPFRPIKPKKH